MSESFRNEKFTRYPLEVAFGHKILHLTSQICLRARKNKPYLVSILIKLGIVQTGCYYVYIYWI